MDFQRPMAQTSHEPASPPRAPPFPARYRALAFLGRGGESEVWRCVDRHEGDAEVAVKVLGSRRAAGGDPGQLPGEFLALERLSHPNICAVRGSGRLSDGRPYIVTALVHGQNLLDWALSRGDRERWTGLLDLAGQALSVLHFLARRGLRHGDVKPANLLVEREGARPVLQLIDFGVAGLRELASRGHRHRGATPAYAAPADLVARGLDPDLHGLGLSLYQAAAGHLPAPRPRRRGSSEPASSGRRTPPLAAAAPGAPQALCELIDELTDLPASGPFPGARECLGRLRARVPLADLPRARSAQACRIPAREAFLEEIVSAASGGRIEIVVGPEGSGKSQLLDRAALWLEAHGWRIGRLRVPADPVASARLVEAILQGAESETAELGLAHLGEERVALVIDDLDRAQESPAISLLQKFAALVQPGGRLALVGAARDGRAAASALSRTPGAVDLRPLDLLDREAVAAVAREHFTVEQIPEPLLERLERTSGGLVSRLNQELEHLRRAGVKADYFGELVLPGELPPPETAGAVAEDRILELAPAERQVLGLLLLAGEPLTAGEVERLLGDGHRAGDSLETLRAAGLARRETGDPEPASVAVWTTDPEELAGKLLGERAPDLRRSWLAEIARRAAAGERIPPSRWLSAALHLLALGELQRSSIAALRALREDRSGLLRGAIEPVFRRIASASLGHGAATRWSLAVRLRHAEILAHVGRLREAAAALEDLDGPAWLRAQALRLAADSLERAGDLDRSAILWERLEEAGRQGALGPASRLLELLARARLAPLQLRRGKLREGQILLSRGEEIFAPAPELQCHASLRCEVLGRLATAEAVHGDPARAEVLVREALELAERIGRVDLLQGPLNELGIARGKAQRWEEALRAFERVEQVSRSRGDHFGALRAVYNQAVILYRTRDLEQAEVRFREARRLSERLGRHALSSTVWIGLAGLERERGRPLSALRLYRKVLRPGAASRPNDVCLARNNLSEVYLSLGHLDRAAVQAFLAVRLARATANRFLETLSLRTRGICRLALGDTKRARRDLEATLASARGEKDLRGEGETLQALGILRGLEGEPRVACGILARAASRSRAARDRERLLAVRAQEQLFSALARGPNGRRAGRRPSGDHPPGREPEASRVAGRARLAVEAARALGESDTSLALSRILGLCGEAASRGQAWEAIVTAACLVRIGSCLGAAGQPAHAAELRLLLERPGRRLGARRRRELERFWLGDPGPRVEAGLAVRNGGSRLLEHALEQEANEAAVVAAALESLVASCEALAAWILPDPRGPREPVIAFHADGSPVAALTADPAALDLARRGEGWTTSGPLLLRRLSHPTVRRLLVVELPPLPGSAATPGSGEKLDRAAAVVALSVLLREAADEARRERARGNEAREASRRLTAQVTRERQTFDTALLPRDAEVRDPGSGERPGAEGRSPERRITVAASPAMRRVLEKLARVARTDIPVLIIGESGTGKDWLARRIHELSARAARPFLSEICDIPETLLEAELFGHAEGAFTGAAGARQGLFERAAGGAIYLDEVSRLSAALQLRLLRVLEERSVRPLGSEERRAVDFRLLASSTLSFDALRLHPTFRKDLLYRLHGEIIELPPLRERLEDIPILVQEILREHSRVTGRPAPYLHAEALEVLGGRTWPGNLRELDHEIRRLLVSQPLEITRAMVEPGKPEGGSVPPPAVRPPEARKGSLREEKLKLERELLLQALASSGGVATQAAKKLKITRRHLQTLLEKHKLDAGEFRQARKEKPAGPAARGRGGSARRPPRIP